VTDPIVTLIRQGIKANLDDAIDTCEVYDHFAPGDPIATYLWVYPDATDYTESAGTDARRFIVEAIASQTDPESAEDKLDSLMSNGDESVKKAIESDPTLGGIAVGIFVRSCTGYLFFERAGTNYLGVQWTVDVHAPNED